MKREALSALYACLHLRFGLLTILLNTKYFVQFCADEQRGVLVNSRLVA